MKTKFYYNPSFSSQPKAFVNTNEGEPNYEAFYLMGRKENGDWIYLDTMGYIERENSVLSKTFDRFVRQGTWKEITLMEFFKQF